MTADFHVHSTFSDGKCTPEEIVLAAIEKGMDKIGFSDHSHTFFDESYCLPKADIPSYIETIHALREKYLGKIEVLCGIEQDFYSAEPTNGYDYAIGSVHYLKVDGEYLSIDESPEFLQEIAQKLGGWPELFREYFSTVSAFAQKPDIRIIGHFDYLALYNEQHKLFDETDHVYTECARAAADKLIEAGKIFEINTGGVFRGYRSVPYPAPPLMDYILSRGGKFILSSDSHKTDGLCFAFDNYRRFAEIASI